MSEVVGTGQVLKMATRLDLHRNLITGVLKAGVLSIIGCGTVMFVAGRLLNGADFYSGRIGTLLGTSLLAVGVVLVSSYLPARRRAKMERAPEKKYDQQIELEP